MKPNLKMSIKRKKTSQTNSGKQSKVIRCKGKLVNSSGKMVPKVKCSSKTTMRNNRNNNVARNNNVEHGNEPLAMIKHPKSRNNNSPKSKEALAEIIGEITKLRRNDKLFNTLKHRNRKKALENMILRKIIKNKRVQQLRPRKSCKKKFKIVQIPINGAEQQTNPELQEIFKNIAKKNKRKTKCRVRAFKNV